MRTYSCSACHDSLTSWGPHAFNHTKHPIFTIFFHSSTVSFCPIPWHHPCDFSVLLLLLYLQHIYSLNIFTRLCISVLLCSVLEVSLCSGGLHVFGTYFLSSEWILYPLIIHLPSFVISVAFVWYFLYHVSFVERDSFIWALYHSIDPEGCGNVYVDHNAEAKKCMHV